MKNINAGFNITFILSLKESAFMGWTWLITPPSVSTLHRVNDLGHLLVKMSLYIFEKVNTLYLKGGQTSRHQQLLVNGNVDCCTHSQIYA